MKRILPAVVVVLISTNALYADFSYQQEAKITGGAIASLMKFAGAFSKQAREPILTHVYVKGHRIAHVSQRSADITDIDKETITRVDFDRKTYSVTTFEQLKQQLEQMSKDVQSQKSAKDVNMQMNVSAKNTGQTKDISGLSAKELVLTMTVEGTDPQTGKTGSMDIRSDMWMAKVDGYDEVREVYKLMGEKLGFVTGGSFLPMQRPDLIKNMGELYKEMSKVEGMPVETVVSMGGSGQPPSSGSSPSTDESAKAQSASEAAAAAMARLGGIAGGFGGFGRKKKKDDQQQTAADSAPATQNGANAGQLLEMTTRASDFSQASVDDSHFQIPAGFKQVEPDLNRHAR